MIIISLIIPIFDRLFVLLHQCRKADKKYIYILDAMYNGIKKIVTGKTELPLEVRSHKFNLGDLNNPDLRVISGYYKVYDVIYP